MSLVNIVSGVPLGPGEYTIGAYFAGDATHASASAEKTLTVNEPSQGSLLSSFYLLPTRL